MLSRRRKNSFPISHAPERIPVRGETSTATAGSAEQVAQSFAFQKLCSLFFFDRASRTVREYHEKVNYIHLNPVKAGLVSQAEEWKWSSGRDYTGSVAAPEKISRILPVDRILLPAEATARI